MNRDEAEDVLTDLRAMVAQLREDAVPARVHRELRGPRVPEQPARIKRRRAAKAARKRNR